MSIVPYNPNQGALVKKRKYNEEYNPFLDIYYQLGGSGNPYRDVDRLAYHGAKRWKEEGHKALPRWAHNEIVSNPFLPIGALPTQNQNKFLRARYNRPAPVARIRGGSTPRNIVTPQRRRPNRPQGTTNMSRDFRVTKKMHFGFRSAWVWDGASYGDTGSTKVHSKLASAGLTEQGIGEIEGVMHVPPLRTLRWQHDDKHYVSVNISSYIMQNMEQFLMKNEDCAVDIVDIKFRLAIINLQGDTNKTIRFIMTRKVEKDIPQSSSTNPHEYKNFFNDPIDRCQKRDLDSAFPEGGHGQPFNHKMFLHINRQDWKVWLDRRTIIRADPKSGDTFSNNSGNYQPTGNPDPQKVMLSNDVNAGRVVAFNPNQNEKKIFVGYKPRRPFRFKVEKTEDGTLVPKHDIRFLFYAGENTIDMARENTQQEMSYVLQCEIRFKDVI
jgi:hypothetical protein